MDHMTGIDQSELKEMKRFEEAFFENCLKQNMGDGIGEGRDRGAGERVQGFAHYFLAGVYKKLKGRNIFSFTE